MARAKGPESPPIAGPGPPSERRHGHHDTSEHDIGNALRAAYDSAVNEPIPSEMLDLLRKLR